MDKRRIDMERPTYRFMKVRFDKKEPWEVLQGISKYFSGFDMLEIEKRGNQYTFLGMNQEKVEEIWMGEGLSATTLR